MPSSDLLPSLLFKIHENHLEEHPRGPRRLRLSAAQKALLGVYMAQFGYVMTTLCQPDAPPPALPTEPTSKPSATLKTTRKIRDTEQRPAPIPASETQRKPARA